MNLMLSIALVVVAGMLCQWIAWHMKLPAIVPLLAVGFLIGPVMQWANPQQQAGDLFFPFVSLSVAIILFEGALTLNWKQVLEVRGVVWMLLTVGLLVTWLASAAAAHYFMVLAWPLALLFGALIIVTGPTVIAPLLRNVQPSAKIANVLKWEGILIDPIGALVAYIVFEAILANAQPSFNGVALSILMPVITGLLVGLAAGGLVYGLVHYFLVPDYLRDGIVLSLVLLAYALSDLIAAESGLVAVTVMGIFLANTDLRQLREIFYFKEKLTILLVSVLFILLTATITRADLALLDWRAFAVLVTVILIVRPLNILVSTLRSDLSVRERLFLAWIAPRGIVAAAVTSLFAFELLHEGVRDAEILRPLVFLMITGTVIIQGGSAKWVARRLGVSDPEPQGVLIMGANPIARMMADALMKNGVLVRLVDSNPANAYLAQVAGLDAHEGDLLSDFVENDLDLAGVGRLLAMTSNDEANALACRHFTDEFGSAKVYQLVPASRGPQTEAAKHIARVGRLLFNKSATYAQLSEMIADNAQVRPLHDDEAVPTNGRSGGNSSGSNTYGSSEARTDGIASRPNAVVEEGAAGGDQARRLLPLFSVRNGTLSIATTDRQLALEAETVRIGLVVPTPDAIPELGRESAVAAALE
jgi:NhaP-type Na+/H+ or K+/H+ antiporter